jgi:PAS domain S-box-containing protein
VTDYPIPPDELARLEELYRYEVLDTPDEEFYDRLTQFAARTFDVPIALISLVDRDRQWFKSRYGLAVKETPREQAFCSHTILGKDTFVVEDAMADPRFAENPFVRGDPGIRFCAAAPLITSRGLALGSICVIDRRPRKPTAEQLATLNQLSVQIIQQLELRHVAEALRRQSLLLEKVQRAAKIGGWELDLRSNVLTWTEETYRIHGLTRDDYTPTPESAIGFYTPESAGLIRRALDATMSAGTPYDMELQIRRHDGEYRWVRTTGMREDEEGQLHRLFGVFQDITEHRRLEREIVRIAQREQMRIGSDLHDGLGQELTGIALSLGGLIGRDPGADPVSRDDLRQIESLVRTAITQCRSLAEGASPTALEIGGLIGATRHLAARIEKIHGIVVRVRIRERGLCLDEADADHLYRIIQEAITNALKHATPRRIVIGIDANPVRTLICITNDGKRFVAPSRTEGLGLGIMHYRAQLIGATLVIEPRNAGGTRVSCCLPNRLVR